MDVGVRNRAITPGGFHLASADPSPKLRRFLRRSCRIATRASRKNRAKRNGRGRPKPRNYPRGFPFGFCRSQPKASAVPKALLPHCDPSESKKPREKKWTWASETAQLPQGVSIWLVQIPAQSFGGS